MSSQERESVASGATRVAVSMAKSWVLRAVLGVALPAIGWMMAIFLGFMVFVGVAIGSYQSLSGVFGGSPSAAATADIPPEMMAIYQSQFTHDQCPQLPWNVLAAVGKIETDHFRLDQPGVRSGANFAGAMGPMQFLRPTFAAYGVDGPGRNGIRDGVKNVYDPYDAVPSAANYLCALLAVHGDSLRDAIFGYNHSWEYVNDVLAQAKEYASDPGPGCGSGIVTIEAGANRPGMPVKPETMCFLQKVAAVYGKPLICTTGTDHDKYVNNSERVSDHWDGHACDFGMASNGGTNDGPVGDAIETACLIAAGDPPALARQEARRGTYGNHNLNGLRIQCIWKADADHHNHVHIGANPN